MDSAPSFLEILKVLSRHEAEFILVGGMAAILEGAPVSTFDLDTVFSPPISISPKQLSGAARSRSPKTTLPVYN